MPIAPSSLSCCPCLLPCRSFPSCCIAPSSCAQPLLLFYTRSLLPFMFGRSFLSCSVAPSPHTSVALSHLHSRKSSMVSIRRYLHLLPPQIPHATSLFHLPFTHCHPLVANTSIPNHSFCSCTSHRPSILLYYTTRLLRFFRSPRNKCYCCILSLVFCLYVIRGFLLLGSVLPFFIRFHRYFFFFNTLCCCCFFCFPFPRTLSFPEIAKRVKRAKEAEMAEHESQVSHEGSHETRQR